MQALNVVINVITMFVVTVYLKKIPLSNRLNVLKQSLQIVDLSNLEKFSKCIYQRARERQLSSLSDPRLSSSKAFLNAVIKTIQLIMIPGRIWMIPLSAALLEFCLCTILQCLWLVMVTYGAWATEVKAQVKKIVNSKE